MRLQFLVLALAAAVGTVPGHAGVLVFGDMDCLGEGCYGASSPIAGATLQGLAPNTTTLASAFFHGYPFAPGAEDFPGTDAIHAGSTQTRVRDGYSASAGRLNGPQVFTLDYSSLIAAGQSLATLTLGIAADDFQFPTLGQPFTASVNGSVNAALTAQLNALSQSGPIVQFLTIGLNPAIDTGSHVLSLSISGGGDGGDGWAVDFLTVGATVTANAAPEPSTMAMLALGLGGLAVAVTRRRK